MIIHKILFPKNRFGSNAKRKDSRIDKVATDRNNTSILVTKGLGYLHDTYMLSNHLPPHS